MIRRLGLAALMVLALAAAALAAQRPPEGLPLYLVRLGGAQVICESPQSQAQRSHGLAGRNALAPGRGMVFLNRRPRPMTMHMRGMRFAIDMIWVEKGRVLAVEHQVPPDPGAPGMRGSPGSVEAVVEVPAGWARSQGVAPGQPVRITPYTDKP